MELENYINTNNSNNNNNNNFNNNNNNVQVTTVDVIIPSFRFDKNQINCIIDLKYPDDFVFSITIVVDNPLVTRINDLQNERVNIIYNKINLGSSQSRNLGIQMTKGDWILFLDDDIYPDKNLLFSYAQFIKNDSLNYSGAVGLVKFPPAINRFTRSIICSQMLDCFNLPEKHKDLFWGVSANVLLSRIYLDDFLFSNKYPKKGGGEDIDLLFRIFKKSKKPYKPLPNAVVHHPWWLNGKRSYIRFYRWSYGDSLLPLKFPEYRYYELPNAIELIFIVTLFFPILEPLKYLVLVFSVLSLEIIIEILKQKQIISKNSVLMQIEVLLIKSANDLGRLIGNLSRFRLILFERFDFYLNEDAKIKNRKWSVLKLCILMVIILLIFA